MSPTANKKTHPSPETGFEEEEYDADEFEDLLEPVEEFEVANYKNLLKEETLKTNILRKVWKVRDDLFILQLSQFYFGLVSLFFIFMDSIDW